ncbi:MAG: NUDIX domain-containing protein [Clostridia bacterium]|nr:NUDIX domain-containing protein [Clostridia bacterium]
MKEVFAKPCVGAIVERTIEGEKYILIQTRQKPAGDETNGKLELPAGKIREYEDVFFALRREVWEETGLRVTKIQGESSAVSLQTGEVTTVSFTPYCTTQNLSGAYSIILHTFLCEAEGELMGRTEEAEDIHWMKVCEIRELVDTQPERFFFMHLHALKKYLEL